MKAKSRIERIAEEFYARPARLKTWSGMPLKEVYTPEDVVDTEYEKDVNNPGGYPFARGIFPKMYRGKLWTRRQQTGWGLAEETNRQLKFLIEEGATGLVIYRDLPTVLGLDADHPLAQHEVCRTGISLCSLEDMEAVTADIPLDKVSMNLLCASCASIIVLAMYIACAEKGGIGLDQLRGTLTHDSLQSRFVYSKEANPIDLGLKVDTDIVEYCTKNMPLWNSIYVGVCYNLREEGALTAPQEVAFGLAAASTYVRSALKRGLDIDSFAPNATVYCQAGIDLFEEAAKIRALRRMWAKRMRDEFGAKNPRSWRLQIGVQTSGSQLVAQQPLNNTVRIAYQLLAGVLGGVQSITCCTYVEPLSLPTLAANTSALRTHQILAYETSVPAVADPLGGSYYVESLTNTIEEEANKILSEIEKMGGFAEAIRQDWVEKELEKGALRFQRELENKERIIVGVNAFVTPPEEDIIPGGIQRVSLGDSEQQLRRLKNLRERRDQDEVKDALDKLYIKAQKGENLLPPLIEAVKVYATIEEMMGTIRQAHGYSPDPFNLRNGPYPF